MAFSGGIVTNYNQSAAYIRMFARDATTDIDACYITGVAIRPLGDETVTLTGDYRFESGLIPDRWSAGAEIRAIDGLTVRGAYGQNDTYTVGLQLDFGNGMVRISRPSVAGPGQGPSGLLVEGSRPVSIAISPRCPTPIERAASSST